LSVTKFHLGAIYTVEEEFRKQGKSGDKDQPTNLIRLCGFRTCCMNEQDGKRKRRVFNWTQEAKNLVQNYRARARTTTGDSRAERRLLVAKLIEISGNPRDACLRWLRHLGVAQRQTYREWTKPEQQRVLDLIVSMPVEDVARTLRRTSRSVRSMLHRLDAGGRRGREWFTRSSLATVLHIRPDEVQKWIDRGWLKCRVLDSEGLKRQIIDPDDFCNFFKQYGRQVVGRRLNYDRLWFVHNYVFPPSHADLFSLRESYKKRTSGTTESAGAGADQSAEEDEFEQSA
jgi:hypothetical protein